MAFRESVVRIRRFTQVGSGTFVAPDLVLTAGHVLEAGGRDPKCMEFNVVHPATMKTWRVTGIRADARWRLGSDPSADVGLLRVVGPAVPVLGIGTFDGGMVTRYGIPANPNDPLGASATGMTVVDSGFVFSDDADMQIPQGASGGPLLDGRFALVGIGTGLGVPGLHGNPIGIPIGATVPSNLLSDPNSLIDGQ
jgi:hypothetical protein